MGQKYAVLMSWCCATGVKHNKLLGARVQVSRFAKNGILKVKCLPTLIYQKFEVSEKYIIILEMHCMIASVADLNYLYT